MSHGFDLRLFLISLLRKIKTMLLFLVIGAILGGGFRVTSLMLKAVQDTPELEYQSDKPDAATLETIQHYYDDSVIFNLSPSELCISKLIFYVRPQENTMASSSIRDTSKEICNAYPIIGMTMDAVFTFNSLSDNPLSSQSLMDMVLIQSDVNSGLVTIYSIGTDKVASELLGKVVFDTLNLKVTEQMGKHAISKPLISTTQGYSTGYSSEYKTLVEIASARKKAVEQEFATATKLFNEVESSSFNIAACVKSSVKYAALCGAVGAALALLLMFMFEALSIKVESDSEFRSRTGLRVLGLLYGKDDGHA